MVKHYIIITLFLLIATVVSAQSSSTPKEVGFQISSISPEFPSTFSAFYKKQKSENVYRRVRFVSGRLSFFTLDDDRTDFDFFAGIAIGKEKRRSLDRKLIFYRGPEYNFNLSANSVIGGGTVGFGLGFGYVFGLQHNFNEFWSVNMETIPGVGVNLSFAEEDANFLFNSGLSNLVSLGLVRRF
jgi:hypothetical protein